MRDWARSLFGLTLFALVYMYTPGIGFGPNSLFVDAATGQMTSRAAWITIGMTLAFIMWFNVWMIIWPAQRRLLTGKVPAANIPAVRRRAFLASRANTFLSGPMLFGMLAPSHYGAMNGLSLALAFGLGLAAIWFSIRSSSSVGKLA